VRRLPVKWFAIGESLRNTDVSFINTNVEGCNFFRTTKISSASWSLHVASFKQLQSCSVCMFTEQLTKLRYTIPPQKPPTLTFMFTALNVSAIIITSHSLR
jgi:hypothetical protein